MSSPRTDAVVRFAADWQRSLHSDRLPPQIRDYVPDGTQVRLAVLIDLIRVDLRRRWEREGLGKRIAEYREEFPEVAGSPQLLDLVCEEFLARRGRGPLPTEDFLAEYPDLTDAIRERLADFAAEDADEAGESSDALAALADLAPGLRIDDFDLLTDLGAGLLGRVFLARQRSMQRLVAVRFSAGRAGAPHTMAQLDHAHIVRVFDQRVLSADAARTLTVAGTPANGSPTADAESTIAAPRPAIAEPFEPDDTVAAPPPGRTASRPDDDATIAAPRLPGIERADLAAERRSTADDATVAEAHLPDTERRPAADDATVAQPHLRDTERADVAIGRRSTVDDATVAAATNSTVAARPPGRTASRPDDDATIAQAHLRDTERADAAVGRRSTVDDATVAAATHAPRDGSDDTTVTSPYRARRPHRAGAPVPDHEAGRSAESGNGTAVLDDPDATPTDIDPDATRTDPREYADASTGRPPPAPVAPVAPLPRLVYMQYLPGGTAVGVLEQRRRGPVTDGGALLLRAVDTAMEDKGEIRPSDSSVRAEIARLSWPETVAWVGRRLADALDYAEHHGVLHHDIKPANVLFTAEGIPKLADFALGEAAARIPAPRDPGATDALVYRSPEQLAHYLDPGAPAPGNASDVYSLGVLLWEMLTGASPFDDPPPTEEGSVTETYARMLAVRRDGVPAAALSRLPDDTPAALRRVLLECLHADPQRRWRSGAELAGQLDLCLDTRARDLVDPPPNSLAYRARGWLLPVAALCVGVPNVLASFYNIQLNQALIIDRMSAADQEKFAAVGLINNLVAFPVAALLLLFMTRRPLTIAFRLGRGEGYSARTLAKARRDTLLMGDWAVWIPFGFWLVAGIIWPLGLAFSGVDLPRGTFLHFFAAQVVCAAIALAYPFFPIMVYAVRSIYPQLLVRGGIGPGDEKQLRALAKRGNFYLGVAASVPLLGVASATFVNAADLELVIVPVRVLSVGGILAFVLTYRLFRLLEADLLALARAIPQRTR
ncbi:protein kinase domain-containing protein [Nocardia abscessus]|uniref:protein kinase domain-containing protein n=1 Tax=Nocardia abscessus TaxID=120957 RepID=UPI002454699A|nr:protein kinase [Nocardia abscessus]